MPVDVISVREDGASYVLELACKNCDHIQIGCFSEDAMLALDEHLDRTFTQIAATADRVARTLAEHKVESFAAALRLGHVLPEDF